MVPAEQDAAGAKTAGDSQAAPAVAIREMQRPVDSKDLIFIIGGPGCGKVCRQFGHFAAQEGVSVFQKKGGYIFCCTAVSQSDREENTFQAHHCASKVGFLKPVIKALLKRTHA